MRLKSLYIDGYKNLKNFSITFDTDSFIDVFVGKNGSGKSNFFEALIDIFRFLYELNKGKPSLAFDFKIEYVIDTKPITIEWSRGILIINGEKNRKTLGSTPVPDNMIVYYSGHNEKVSAILKDYLDSFRPRVQKAGFKEMRKIIGIGSDYKQLLLILMLIQPERHKVRRYICEKLGITNVAKEVKIVLKRPFFADKDVVVERFNPSSAYWGAKGTSKTFLDRLARCHVESSSRDEGYIESRDIYVFYLDIDLLRKEFKDVSLLDLFIQFDNLKTIDMLESISSEVTLRSGASISTDYFSDGQFQSIFIYSIVELFRERTCLTLLDEPDCYLHPEWQFEFLKQVVDISSQASEHNHILLSSHSAVTLISHPQKRIRLFEIDTRKIKQRLVAKCEAIEELSAKLIKYSEAQQILSIMSCLRAVNKPVFFTEGKSDVQIITTAWSKLYKEDMPFFPLYAFGCEYLRRLLQDSIITEELGENCMFGLFDFDAAYNEWNSLKSKKNTVSIEDDPYKGLCVFLPDCKSYAFMLPVPKIPNVESLVIKDPKTTTTFKGRSRLGIEHLFYGDTSTHEFFHTEEVPGGGSVIVFNEKSKIRFADEVVPHIDAGHFEIFKSMFEVIMSICSPVS